MERSSADFARAVISHVAYRFHVASGVQVVEVISEPTGTGSTAEGAGAGPLFEPPTTGTGAAPSKRERTLTIRGEIPTEVWNRLGRTLIPKLKTGNELVMKLDVSVQVDSDTAQGFQQELLQILRDLNLADSVRIVIEQRVTPNSG